MVIEEKIFYLGFFTSTDTFNFSSPTAYRHPLVKAQSGRAPMPLCNKATLLKGVTTHTGTRVCTHRHMCAHTLVLAHVHTYTCAHTCSSRWP